MATLKIFQDWKQGKTCQIINCSCPLCFCSSCKNNDWKSVSLILECKRNILLELSCYIGNVEFTKKMFASIKKMDSKFSFVLSLSNLVAFYDVNDIGSLFSMIDFLIS